jgi:hypothetical protein
MKKDYTNRNAKTKHYLISTAKALFGDGVGKSKHAIFQSSYEEKRIRTSPSIHTYSTANRYITVVSKFADFLKEEYNLKYERDFKKLATDELYACVDRYFEKQREAGLSASTLKIHISALHKVLGVTNPEIKEHFTPDNRARWRDGVERGDNDRYSNPDRIIENLHKINETSAAIAELQRLTGARIGDVKKIHIDEDNKRVFIEHSKGGRDRYVYYDYFQEDFEKVKHYKEVLDRTLQEKQFSEIREKQYYDDLRKACRKADEPYHGSHPFRYEFAQSRYEVISQLPKEEQESYYLRILEERGKTQKEIDKAFDSVKPRDAVAEAIISEELGHSRLDISRHYLKLRAK